ncbi:MAG: putative glycoside hydrolase [Chlamydiota bacterium]
MKPTVPAALAAVLAFILAPAESQPRQFPDTRSGIHLFSDQMQSDMTAAQCQFAATHYAGCQKMLLNDVGNLRAYNPGFIALHYQLGCGNGPAPFIDGNEWVSDWSIVNAQESWFMHSGLSRLYMGAWNWYLMDIANSDWQSYWVNACIDRMQATSCDGVFADSFTVDAYFDQLTPPHPWLSDPNLCKAQWIPRLDAWADYITARFAGHFYFIPNLGGLVTGWDTTNYAGLGDGGMVEGFGGWGNGNYFPTEDWILQMNRVLDLVRQDRIVICQSYTSDSGLDERMFLTGCYLLIKGDRTYFNMIGAEHGEELLYYPEYGIPTGAYSGSIPSSVGALYDPAAGCFRRNYANGFVLVNPGETPVTVPDLGGTYQLVSAQGGGSVNEGGGHTGSLSYAPVTSVEVPAHGAAVLLGDIPSTLHTVTLSLDNAAFLPSESLTLHWGITRAPAGPSVADAWVAVMTPWGTIYFYRAGSFSPSVRSVAPSLPVSDLSGDLGPFTLEGLQSGAYTWYGVLTYPGANPLDSSSRVSTLGTASFSIN